MSQNSDSKPGKSTNKRYGLSLVLVLSSICIAFLILELAVRLLPPPYPEDTGEIFACQPDLGWSGRPNFQGTFEDPNFRQQLSFNSLGMHDSEHRLEKPAGSWRILMLGDSFVHGVQVSEAETAHQVLENQLLTGGRQVEVISAGVINWGTNQQLIFYRKYGQGFQPDMVLLMVYLGNDLMDNLPGNGLTIQGFNCYAPYFAWCSGGLNPNPLTYAPGVSDLENNCSPVRRTLINGLGELYQYSRLYQQLEPLITANYPRQQFGLSYPRSFAALYLPDEEPELEQAWQVTEATIAQLQQEVEANGGQFAVALISPEVVVNLGALSPDEQAIFLRDNPTFAEAELNRPNQRLADFLTDHQIPFIDLTGPLTEHLKTNRIPLYLIGEGHWTVEGNRVVADTLARWLIDNKLLESEP